MPKLDIANLIGLVLNFLGTLLILFFSLRVMFSGAITQGDWDHIFPHWRSTLLSGIALLCFGFLLQLIASLGSVDVAQDRF